MIETILFIFHVLYEICKRDFFIYSNSLYSSAKSEKMYLQVSIWCSLIQDGFRETHQ